MKLRTPTTQDNKAIREIAREFGINGVKKGTNCTHVGRQCQMVEKEKSEAFIEKVEQAGFYVEDIFKEASQRGIADTFLVWKNVGDKK